MVNHDLININNWLCANKLQLNVDKTKCMVISNRNKCESVNVIINNSAIECVDSMKYLGLIIDKQLKMKRHIDYISKKIAKKIGFLARISKNLNYMDRIRVYQTIIAPHFEYCPSVLFMNNESDFQRLQKLQNRAMRIILRCNRRTNVKEMLSALCWMSIKQRIYYQTFIFIFKMKLNLLPTYLTKNIKYRGECHNHPVRGENNFHLPSLMKTSSRNTVFHKGLQMFNKLPSDIKTECDLNKFKRLIAKYVKEKF